MGHRRLSSISPVSLNNCLRKKSKKEKRRGKTSDERQIWTSVLGSILLLPSSLVVPMYLYRVFFFRVEILNINTYHSSDLILAHIYG